MEKNSQNEESENQNNKIDEQTEIIKSSESLCTPCAIEISQLSRMNNDENLSTVDLTLETDNEILENLLLASKSFSEISIKEEFDFDVEQETLFHIENANNNHNVNDNSTFSRAQKNYLEKNRPNLSNFEKDVLSNEENDYLLRISSLHEDDNRKKKLGESKAADPEEPQKKRLKSTEITILCDKSVQTENPLILPNYEEITKNVMNRKRNIHELANDIYTSSCYLDEIKKALASGTSSGAIIPQLPKLSGYDEQFDFPDRSRFSKLPITIESVVSLKRDDVRENSTESRENSSNFGNTPNLANLSNFGNSSNGRGQRNHKKLSASHNVSSVKSTKMKNRVEISLPNRFKQQQQAIKEMLLAGNKENNFMNNNQINRMANKSSNQSDVSSGRDDSSDNGSLFNYNPLRYARENKK